MSSQNDFSDGNFKETWILYMMHACFSFVSRVWDMGVVLLLADLTNNSLFIVAIAGFLSSGLIVLFAGPTGAIIDKSNRMNSMSIALLTKLIAVTIGYSISAVLMGDKAVAERTAQHHGEPLEFEPSPFVYVIPVFVAIANFAFSMIVLSVEKDWIVVLSSQNKEWLSQLNSTMSQIDMACMAIAPIFTGWIFAEWSGSFIAVFLLGSNAVVTLIFYLFVRRVYFGFPPLWQRREEEVPASKPTTESEGTPLLNGPEVQGDATRAHVSVHSDPIDCYCWYFKCLCRDFFENSGNCGGVMLSYACLYMTVLSFGTLMTVYLYGAGMSLYWIGILRGGSALSGFAGAAIYPYCQRTFGLWRTGQWAIVQQLVFVSIAAAPLYMYGHQQGVTTAAFVLATAVLCSRAGLWLFDLCVRQIAQECIPESHRGRVNGQWKSVVSFFNMLSYVVAMVWAQPSQFAYLTTTSATMVAIAFLVYTLSNCSVGKSHSSTGAEGYVAVMEEPDSEGHDVERAVELVMPDMETVPHISFSSAAPNSRKDGPGQSKGSVLGGRDHHPSVVASVSQSKGSVLGGRDHHPSVVASVTLSSDDEREPIDVRMERDPTPPLRSGLDVGCAAEDLGAENEEDVHSIAADLLAAVCIQAAYRAHYYRNHVYSDVVSHLRMWSAARAETRLLRMKHAVETGDADVDPDTAVVECARLEQLAREEQTRLTQWEKKCVAVNNKRAARLNLLKQSMDAQAQEDLRLQLNERQALVETAVARRAQTREMELAALVEQGQKKLQKQRLEAEESRADSLMRLAELRAATSAQAAKRALLEEEHREGVKHCWGRDQDSTVTRHSLESGRTHAHSQRISQKQFLLNFTIRLQAKFRGDHVRRSLPDVVTHMQLWRAAHEEAKQVRLTHYKSAAHSAIEEEADEFTKIRRNIEESATLSIF